ncbi:hypothetical protein [Actinomadura madurae]|uniref:hypothetical protein n=1 Tax=Actinomadura madurae TaxID=1993 RepID=UPI0020D24DB4|nr:hypothetical protein [Actinomadura madurae]MCQ0007091.1 hypothetical protein [Actinomadura madurae]
MSETTSQDSVGFTPNSAHFWKTGRPMPMLVSVSTEIDTLEPAPASRAPLLVAEGVAVDVHHVRAEQPGVGDLVESGRHLPDARHVRGDQGTVRATDLDLPARVGERNQAEFVEGDPEGDPARPGEVRRGDALEVPDTLGMVGEVRRRERAALEEAVAEPGPHSGIQQPGDRGIGVLRGVVAVREVEDRRHTCVEGLQGAELVAQVHVSRGVRGGDREPDPVEVVGQRPVGADRAGLGLPGVPVGVDHPRCDDVAGDVEDLGIGHVQLRSDGDDGAVLDEDVTLRENPGGGVHGDELGSAQEQACGHGVVFRSLLSVLSVFVGRGRAGDGSDEDQPAVEGDSLAGEAGGG